MGEKGRSLTLGPQWGTIRAVQPYYSAVDTLPLNCRQRLKASGQPYPKSSCEACGILSPRWKECDAEIAKPLNSPDSPPGSYHYHERTEFVSLLSEIALISHGGGLIGFDSQAEALRKIREITKSFLRNQLDDLQQPDQNQEACKEHVGFHLQPGDQCRLLDGPLMIYLGAEELDEEGLCFGYWTVEDQGHAFVTTIIKPSVARFVKK